MSSRPRQTGLVKIATTTVSFVVLKCETSLQKEYLCNTERSAAQYCIKGYREGKQKKRILHYLCKRLLLEGSPRYRRFTVILTLRKFLRSLSSFKNLSAQNLSKLKQPSFVCSFSDFNSAEVKPLDPQSHPRNWTPEELRRRRHGERNRCVKGSCSSLPHLCKLISVRFTKLSVFAYICI